MLFGRSRIYSKVINEIDFKPHAAANVHNTVINLLKNEKGKLLDVGAGEGELVWRLKKLDFDIVACDINPDNFKVKDIKCDCVDFNEDLPYENKSFNLITCVEVLEHLKKPYNAISEISRILKPNGIAIITTPNIMNWYSRFRFLKNGVFNDYFLFEEFSEKAKLGHIHPFYYPQLKYFLDQNSLVVEKLTADRCPGLSNMNNGKITKSFVVYLLFNFIMKPQNKVLMEGNTLIIKARKIL